MSTAGRTGTHGRRTPPGGGGPDGEPRGGSSAESCRGAGAAGRPPLRRPEQDRWLAGVAAGVAAHLGVRTASVRLGLVGLVVATLGAGAVAYPLLWAVVPGETSPSADPADVQDRLGRGGSGLGEGDRGESGLGESGRGERRSGLLAGAHGTQVLLGAALLVVGGALLAEHLGGDLPVPVSTVAAVTACTGGLLLAWGRLDDSGRERWLEGVGGASRSGALRLVAGLALAALGLVLLAAGAVDAAALRTGVLAGGAVLLGVLLLLAPWGLRLVGELRAERSERLRAVERAEIGAELHDSVLQVLALLQRRSDDPAEVARLARATERELRAWLRPAGAAGPTDLEAAVRDAVAEVEDAAGVPVDVVVVGAAGAPVDADARALVAALREAVLNAVRHGRPPVQVFCEVDGTRTTAFVRDHGDGVDLDAVPADRLGLRESVLGRMARHGGRAVVRRPPGGGTEVELVSREAS